jgi:hypothetical protein
VSESWTDGEGREFYSRRLASSADPLTAVSRALTSDVKTQIRRLGGNFMKSAQARHDAAALGLPDLSYYFAGRGGVLGDVDDDAIGTLFHFFPTELVRAHWQVTRERMSPRDVGLRYTETCRNWGRARLQGWPQVERLAELLEFIANAASTIGLPLFAAWHSVPLPDDGPGRVVQLAHVLREHRGGQHAIAVLAVLSRDDGAARARLLHWTEPFPPVTDEIRARRQAIEELTDDLAAPPYAVLDDAEAAELKCLLDAAYRTAVVSPGTA